MLKLFVAALLLAEGAHAGPLSCLDVFSKSIVISSFYAPDLRAQYPLESPSAYAAKGDWANYFEMSLKEIYQTNDALNFDLVRENQIFQTLLTRPPETLRLGDRDVTVTSDGATLQFTWVNVLGASERLIVRKPEAPAADTVFAKAAAYQDQFLSHARSSDLYREYVDLKLAALPDLKLNGQPIGSLAKLREQQSDLALQRTLGLLPLAHTSELLRQLAENVRSQGRDTHAWGTETLTLAPSPSMGFVYSDPALKLKVSIDTSQTTLTIVGTLHDPIHVNSTTHFEVSVQNGVVSVVSGQEAILAASARVTRDLQSIFDELVPSYTDFLTPQSVIR